MFNIPSPGRLKNNLVLYSVIPVFFLAAIILTGACPKSKPVILDLNGRKETVQTSAATVGGLLRSLNVNPGPWARVAPGYGTSLNQGETVKVFQAVPVTIKMEGLAIYTLTNQSTVAGVLGENKIVITPEDEVLPGLTARIHKGMDITVRRITARLDIKKVALPFNIEVIPSSNLPPGMTQVVRAGQSGLEEQVWRTTFVDGKEENNKLLLKSTLIKPRDEIEEVGNAGEVSRSSLRYTEVITVRATAYTFTGDRTATGTIPCVGTIAVDPRFIPLGTRLYVQGYGYGTALDTGGAIKGMRIDLFFNTAQQADDWGVQYVKVYIL